MNILKRYDEQQNEKECIKCAYHVTREGTNEDLHFCAESGKILLFPNYLPQNCDRYKQR